MRLSSLFPFLAIFSKLAVGEYIHIDNHLDYPIWFTQVIGDGTRETTLNVLAYGNVSIRQSSASGVAIKVTPGEKDVDTAGKGVLTLGYTKQPAGWIYYDLGVHLYYPFPGSRVKLDGPGGDNDWNDGQAHPQDTKGYYGKGDLWLDIGY